MLSRMARERQLHGLYGENIPTIYGELTLQGFLQVAGDDPGKRVAIRAVTELMRNHKISTSRGTYQSILLWGQPGVGKTGLLTPAFQELANGRSALWISLLDLSNRINAGYETNEAYKRLDAAQSVDLLFIDDMGDPLRKTATDGMRNNLNAIIWHRHALDLPTIMTSNLSPEQIKIQFSEALYQRLATMAVVIEMSGKILRNL